MSRRCDDRTTTRQKNRQEEDLPTRSSSGNVPVSREVAFLTSLARYL